MTTKTKTKKPVSSKNKNDTLNSSDHAWRYFDLHACQRISLFRYYVILLSLYVTGSGFLFAKFNENTCLEEWGVIFFSIIFILITIVFWCLDGRNRKLIHLAEKSLRKHERVNCSEYTHRIFIREKNTPWLTKHTFCFRTLYVIAIGSALIIMWCSWKHIEPPLNENRNQTTQIYLYKNTTN